MEKTEKRFLIIIAALAIIGFLGWTFIGKDNRGPELADSEEISNEASCEESEMPIRELPVGNFRSINEDLALGTISLTGVVVSEEREIWDENVTAVYLAILEDEKNEEFYDHYRGLVENRNTVNLVENNTLFFKIGVLEGRLLLSTASISEKARVEILRSLEEEQGVNLNVVVPIYEGTEAPASFSFACAITSAE